MKRIFKNFIIAFLSLPAMLAAMTAFAYADAINFYDFKSPYQATPTVKLNWALSGNSGKNYQVLYYKKNYPGTVYSKTAGIDVTETSITEHLEKTESELAQKATLQNLSELDAKLAALNGILENFKEEQSKNSWIDVEELSQKLNPLTSATENINQQLQACQNDLNASKEAFKETLAAQEEARQNLEAKIEPLNQAAVDLEQNFKNLNQELEQTKATLASQANLNQDLVRKLSQKVEESDPTTIKADVAKLQTSLAAVEENLGSVIHDLNQNKTATETKLAEQMQEIKTLAAQTAATDDLDLKLTPLNHAVENVASDLLALKENLANQDKTQTSKIQSQIESLDQAHKATQSQIADLKTYAENLSQNFKAQSSTNLENDDLLNQLLHAAARRQLHLHAFRLAQVEEKRFSSFVSVVIRIGNSLLKHDTLLLFS